jgi:heme-degrading monooxygenase HmoA
MSQAKGLKQSFGVGEVPFIKQATLSIWEDEASIKNFAYSMQQHKQVVQKTRAENWYSEDMFTRFNVLEINGSLK